MEKLNLFMPQWQGSGITKELFDGSYALKNFIENQEPITFKNITIDQKSIPAVANDILGYDIIVKQLKQAQEALREISPNKIFALGGGCGIEIPIVSYLREKHEDITLLWFDAHGDLNSPQSSKSKHFHGMPLRFLTDESQFIDGISINKVPTQNVNLLGVRDLDEVENIYIECNKINALSVESIKPNDIFNSGIIQKHGKAYIHIDLDVLDPKEYRNVKCPTASGLSIYELVNSIKVIGNHIDVVGVSILENTEIDNIEIKKLNDIIKFGVEF